MVSEETKQEARVFTRADVEQYFLKMFQGQCGPDESVHIERVFLLKEVSPPTWEVSYAVYSSRTSTRFHSTVLAYQSTTGGSKHLTPITRENLPEGCTTATDEDIAINERNAERARGHQYIELLESWGRSKKDGEEGSR